MAQKHPQGLKPIDFNGFIGTTEVVPCLQSRDGLFSQPVKPCPFKTRSFSAAVKPQRLVDGLGALLDRAGLAVAQGLVNDRFHFAVVFLREPSLLGSELALLGS